MTSLIAAGKLHRLRHTRLDDQHQQMVAIANELFDAFRSGRGEADMRPLLQRLIDCAQMHFVDEEASMRHHAYPAYAKHKAEHEVLLRQIIDLQKRLDKGQASFDVEVIYFIRHWIMRHVAGSDKRYGAFMQSQADPSGGKPS